MCMQHIEKASNHENTVDFKRLVFHIACMNLNNTNSEKYDHIGNFISTIKLTCIVIFPKHDYKLVETGK